jgi:hypothetical protein
MTDVSCCRKCLTVFAKKGCEQEDTSARAQRNAVIIARIAWSGSASGLVACRYTESTREATQKQMSGQAGQKLPRVYTTVRAADKLDRGR